MNEIVSPDLRTETGALPMSAPERGEGPPPPRRGWRSRLTSRPVRILLALILVGAAGLSIIGQRLVISSEHAVISAALITIRTPIRGEVTDMAAQVGERMADQAVLAIIRNPLADRGRLLDAIEARDRASAEAAQLGTQIAALDALAETIRKRATEHRHEASDVLAASIREGEQAQAAAEARALKARQDATRAQSLNRTGIVATAGLERAEAERDAAQHEAASLAARNESLRRQQQAIGQGVFVSGGYGGIGYPEQRLDEIALRRAELVRQQAAQEAGLVRARMRVAEESAHHEAEREVVLHASGDVWGWRVLARRGQRVLPDEIIVEMVNCREVFLLAAVPQTDVPRIGIGTRVRLRLDGESEERPGKVTGWITDGTLRADGHLAVLPTRPRGASQVARVAIAQPRGQECPVGRTGRVLFDRAAADTAAP